MTPQASLSLRRRCCRSLALVWIHGPPEGRPVQPVAVGSFMECPVHLSVPPRSTPQGLRCGSGAWAAGTEPRGCRRVRRASESGSSVALRPQGGGPSCSRSLWPWQCLPLSHHNAAIQLPGEWTHSHSASPRAPSPHQQADVLSRKEGSCAAASLWFSLPAPSTSTHHLLSFCLAHLSIHLPAICLCLSWVISILILTGALSWPHIKLQ